MGDGEGGIFLEEERGRWRKRHTPRSMNSMPRPKFPLLENLKYHGSQYQIDNVARGEMTTRSHVYKKKTQSIFKAPKETEVLEYFGAGSGSWILEIQN